MARKGYRAQDKQINVFVSLALHARVKAEAAALGVSVQDWVVNTLRVALAADVQPVAPDWDAILAAGRDAKTRNTVLQDAEPDPWEDIA